MGDAVNMTATQAAAKAMWFRSSEAWAAYELIKLYQQEFGDDWKEYYRETVRIEVPRG